jgi:hypothetical protein
MCTHLTCLGLLIIIIIGWIGAFRHRSLRLIHCCLTKLSSRLCQISEESSMLVRYLRKKKMKKKKSLTDCCGLVLLSKVSTCSAWVLLRLLCFLLFLVVFELLLCLMFCFRHFKLVVS